jgi:crotonobetainyl-CoA:carnitine CoA-transferase CaiB-like acyl-CoA transferase
MRGPLTGIKVIEWSTWAIGPLAGLVLADLGADVIKVEDPQTGGDPARHIKWAGGFIDCELPKGRNALFEAMNRNKRSITLHLKHPAARELLYSLVREADVFLHNFRPGVPERLGLDYDSLSHLNPRLVYAAGSGYGPLGPDATRPALDYAGQARSGLMWAMGHPGDPPYWGSIGFADAMGGIMLAMGTLAAIAARQLQGVGQRVDASHLGASMFLQTIALGILLLSGDKEWPRFDRRAAGNPLWNHYRCQDGRWLALAMIQPDRYWHDFCDAIGQPELADDPRFQTTEQRRLNCRELVAHLDGIFATRTRDEWEEIFARYPDFIYERVQILGDLTDDPQVQANGYISDFDHPDLGPVRLLNLPLLLSATPASVRSAAPTLGQHTYQVLREELRLSDEEIARLAEAGAI